MSAQEMVSKEKVEVGELALGPRRSGADYTEQDCKALQETVAPVVRALALTARMNGGFK
jgi:hypothetical protein